MERILLLSRDYSTRNPARELTVLAELERLGHEVVFAVPSRSFSKAGYPDYAIDLLSSIYPSTVVLKDIADFERYFKPCGALLMASWKGYQGLTKIARRENKPVAVFSSSSGLDFWGCGADIGLVNSPLHKRIVLYDQSLIRKPDSVPEERLFTTGSVVHEFYKDYDSGFQMDKEMLCEIYEIHADQPIIVLHPKGIGSFRKKCEIWYSSKTEAERVASWYEDQYKRIVEILSQNDMLCFVKMHPSAHQSYMCDVNDEISFWTSLGAKIVQPEHTYAFYRHATCGIGINTHSSLDYGYFGKPFVYVDYDLAPPQPDSYRFGLHKLADLPEGPSSCWDSEREAPSNPWMKSWIGHFSRISELGETVQTVISEQAKPDHIDRYVRECWFSNDGKAALRIANSVSVFVQTFAPRRKWSFQPLRHLRRRIGDAYARLASLSQI